MNTARPNAYFLILELSDKMRNMMYKRKVFAEELVTNGFERRDTGETSDAVKVDWVSFATDWQEGLSNPALLFIMRHIVPNLKLYNLLWHREPCRRTAENRILKELVDSQTLFRTEVAGIYIINPIRMWKGNPVLCLEETKELLREHRRPDPSLIKDRRPRAVYTHKTGEDKIRELGFSGSDSENNQP